MAQAHVNAMIGKTEMAALLAATDGAMMRQTATS